MRRTDELFFQGVKAVLEIRPDTFSDTRIQLHWASQLLSAAADAKLEKTADDSHSNLGWNPTTKYLEGRAGCNLNVEKFALDYDGASLSLDGKTLAEASDWLSKKLDAAIKLRDYEMPAHAVQTGAPFSPDDGQLTALAQWYTFGQNTLAGNGELRVWPHHLDLGFWSPGEREGRSIGGGLSPGDPHFDQPYFYINPYGVDKPDTLPELEFGHWTTNWFGAVLTAEELASTKDPAKVAAEFVRLAIKHCQQLIAVK